MRAVRFIPLAYIVGIHGFVMFTPYAALVLSALYISRRYRKLPRLQPIPA